MRARAGGETHAGLQVFCQDAFLVGGGHTCVARPGHHGAGNQRGIFRAHLGAARACDIEARRERGRWGGDGRHVRRWCVDWSGLARKRFFFF